MKDIEIKEVIVSTIRTRGDGTKRYPHRSVVEVFDKNGTLIAEKDPSPDERFNGTDLINFHKWFVLNYKNISPNLEHIETWLEDRED